MSGYHPHNQSAPVLGYGEMSSLDQAQQAAGELHGKVVLGHSSLCIAPPCCSLPKPWRTHVWS